MDTPLLVEEGDSSSRRGKLRDGLSKFSRRSDAIAYGSPYQKAAALVDLVYFLTHYYAEDGIGLPEEILTDQSSFAEAATLYVFVIRFDFLWSLDYFALIILNFFEKTLWYTSDIAISCSEGLLLSWRAAILNWAAVPYT